MPYSKAHHISHTTRSLNAATCGSHPSLPRDLTMLPQSFRGPLNPSCIIEPPTLQHRHHHELHRSNITKSRARVVLYTRCEKVYLRTPNLYLRSHQHTISPPNGGSVPIATCGVHHPMETG